MPLLVWLGAVPLPPGAAEQESPCRAQPSLRKLGMCQPDTANSEPALNGSGFLRKQKKERFCSAKHLFSSPRGNGKGEHPEPAETSPRQTNILPGRRRLQTARSRRDGFPRRGRAGLCPPAPGSHLVAEIDEQHGLQEADESDADLQGHTGEAPRALSRCRQWIRARRAPPLPRGAPGWGRAPSPAPLGSHTPTQGCSPAQPTAAFFCPPKRCVTCKGNTERV